MTDPAGTGSPWRRRNFRIAWAAGFINNTGDWVLVIALPVFVFVETRSGTTTATLFVFQLLAGAIFGPIGGNLVDRWDLKRCLVATNLAQAVTILPLLAVSAERIWPAYLVMAAQSALTQINNPANVALIPRVVATDQLGPANAALAAAESLARLLGAPLGGLLVAWRGLAPVVIIDAFSFLLVAAGLAFLRADTGPRPAPDGSGVGLRGGLKVIRSNPVLTPLLCLQSASQLAQGGFVVLFVVFVVETLGDDGAGLGIIRGTMAIGALVGSALIGRIARRADPTVLFAAGLAGMGLTSLAFWNAPSVTTTLWVYMVLFSLSGIPGAAVSVGLFTTIQTVSPEHVLGRVVGVMGAGDAIGVATGSILAGALFEEVALRRLLNGQAAIYVVAGGLAYLLIPSQRSRSG